MKNNKNHNLFSVIIPVKDLNNFLIKNINSLLKVKSYYFQIEIIIVTNFEVETNKKNPKVKFITSGLVAPGIKRDIGSKIAKGKYLIFLDDDSYISKKYFDRLFIFVKKHPNVFAIGGPGVTPKNQNFFGKLLGSIFESNIISGVQERYIVVKEKFGVLHDDWPSVNLIVNKSIYKKIKGFNTNCWPGEDTILCKKLNNKNIKIFYYPELYVNHFRRGNLLSHLKQISAYAKMRGFFFRKFGQNSLKLKYCLPSLLLIYLFMMVSNFLFFRDIVNSKIIYLPLIIYLTYIFIGSIETIIRSKKIFYLFNYPIIIMTHLSYGFYFLIGIFKKKLPKPKLR